MRTQGLQPTGRAAAPATVIKADPQLPLMVERLSLAEEQMLWRCEAQVQEGIDSATQAGEALHTIRTRKLYRAEFKTFEDYCSTRWRMTDRRARQLADFFVVRRNLELAAPQYDLTGAGPLPATVGGQPAEAQPEPVLPENERVVRKLAGMEPAKQVATWREAVKASGGKTPTSRDVDQVLKVGRAPERAVNEREPEEMPKTPQQRDLLQDVVSSLELRRILDAAQRAVVAIRALQDLVRGNGELRGLCEAAVSNVEGVEKVAKRCNPGLQPAPESWREVKPKKKTPAQRALLSARARAHWNKARAAQSAADKARAKSQGWVICRESRHDTLPHLQVRYDSGKGGWTTDPRKAKVFGSSAAAMEANHRDDLVMSLAKAVRRFEQKI